MNHKSKMAGYCCVFEFPRRSVNGKHEAFLEWDLRFQIIPAAYCGRGLSGNLAAFRNALIPWLIQELDKLNLQGMCSSDTKLLPVLFFPLQSRCASLRSQKDDMYRESGTSLIPISSSMQSSFPCTSVFRARLLFDFIVLLVSVSLVTWNLVLAVQQNRIGARSSK